ncbi:class I SAM-dependent methyltransferase [Salinirarus marinus]|uniref:class I SAM-dependent methyltransferase n=1 Tax=Salinirarus marinus TaxID=3068310 RepID=UPI003C6CB285
MRRFSEAYLSRTREGMWEDSRDALADLDLPGRERILDVGCGTGELSRILAEESDAEVVGVDADPALLEVAREAAGIPVVAGDARRLPVADDAFDLVVCQALLVNLPDPERAIEQFARVSSDLVAAVEPDNSAVDVRSTVSREQRLERRVRAAYLEGVETDVALGETVADRFEDVGLADVSTRRYYHRKEIEPPYSERSLRAATRKASGAGLADHERELRRELADAEYDAIRSEWREMGREVVEQMQAGDYRRIEVVPVDVTVGRVT